MRAMTKEFFDNVKKNIETFDINWCKAVAKK